MKKMDKKNKRIIYFILVCICMITVFIFSNENGEKSQNTSDTVISDRIVKIITKIFPKANQKAVFSIVNFLVRKGAHFTLYLIIGIVIYGAINTYSLKTKNKVVLTIILGLVYAISDEVHQMFVPERSAQIRDVFIDVSGVILGALIGCLIFIKKGSKNGRNRHKTNCTDNLG